MNEELTWFKASASTANDQCVEMAGTPEGGAAVRDSKNPAGPVLRFTRDEFAAWIDGAKNDEFDHLL